MANETSMVISHLSIGTNKFDQAVVFYDKVMAALGFKQLMCFPGAVAYGIETPDFWVQKPIDGKPASVGNGFHLGFVAQSEEEVKAFYKAALEAGGVGEGEPGPRPQYSDAYYGCFVRDLDGNKIEATFIDESKQA